MHGFQTPFPAPFTFIQARCLIFCPVCYYIFAYCLLFQNDVSIHPVLGNNRPPL
ncbi:hypothetical protein BJX68DRAFT_231118 [Aspergillus pseudodeflectus]|uniref:Uncharacterized protein n=1 Tax=Aspergillus pseudodeflectus TaxID=176178 RepID=A0ABR4KU09_9EURO